MPTVPDRLSLTCGGAELSVGRLVLLSPLWLMRRAMRGDIGGGVGDVGEVGGEREDDDAVEINPLLLLRSGVG